MATLSKRIGSRVLAPRWPLLDADFDRRALPYSAPCVAVASVPDGAVAAFALRPRRPFPPTRLADAPRVLTAFTFRAPGFARRLVPRREGGTASRSPSDAAARLSVDRTPRAGRRTTWPLPSR